MKLKNHKRLQKKYGLNVILLLQSQLNEFLIVGDVLILKLVPGERIQPLREQVNKHEMPHRNEINMNKVYLLSLADCLLQQRTRVILTFNMVEIQTNNGCTLKNV